MKMCLTQNELCGAYNFVVNILKDRNMNDVPNKYRIVKCWDDIIAQWTFVLEIDSRQGAGWQRTIYKGDANWAKREAEHYNAEIIDEETAEKNLRYDDNDRHDS